MIGIPVPSSLDLTISVTSFLEKPFRWQAPQILHPLFQALAQPPPSLLAHSPAFKNFSVFPLTPALRPLTLSLSPQELTGYLPPQSHI